MRRQSIISLAVGLVVVAIALFYTIAYAWLHLYVVDHWSSILLVALWAAAVVAQAAWFVQRSREREELIRRYYLSREWVYNHEIGFARIAQAVPDGDAYEFAAFAADSLADMSYGFDVAEAPQDFEPEFMVSTAAFKVRRTGDGAVVSQWRGSLHRVVSDTDGTRGTYEIGTFGNAAELARLLEQNGAIG